MSINYADAKVQSNHIPPAVEQGEYRTPRPQDLGVMATNCPCNLDSICEHDCCVEALRAIHNERLARVKDSVTRDSADQSRLSVSSYGSMDSLNGQALVSPVGPTGDRQPLLSAKRNLVSLVDLAVVLQ